MPTLLYLVWLIWIVNQHTYCGCQEISGTNDIRNIKIQLRFETLLWSWPCKQQSNFCTKHSGLWWCYHLIKFGCQKISSLADMVETVIFDQISPHCDPELEDNKPIYLAWHSLVSEGSAAEEYLPGEHSLKFWTFSVILTWTTTEQFNLFTRQSNL